MRSETRANSDCDAKCDSKSWQWTLFKISTNAGVIRFSKHLDYKISIALVCA